MRLMPQLKCITGIILLTGILSLQSIAQGNLLITPARVIFEGQKKIQELNLANTGVDTAKYLVSFIEIKMGENGSFDKIIQPDSGQNFASAYLRYFPRSVVLAPGEAQMIKVQLTKTSQLTAGEYRSHIYFRAVPDEKPLGEKLPAVDSNSISVKLTPIFGITIPVIIRIGQSTTKITLTDLSLDSSAPGRLSITFNRTGNFSVYGSVSVIYVSPQGKTTKVGNTNGLAIYTPNTRRIFHMDLDTIEGVDYHKGKLQVIYTSKNENGTESQLAKAELQL